DLSADLVDRAAAGVSPLVALDEFTCLGDALPRFRKNVDQASVFHFFGGIDAAAQHHLFGEGGPHPPRHQTVGAHAREQAEDVFREAELHTAFGNDHVE